MGLYTHYRPSSLLENSRTPVYIPGGVLETPTVF